jgi:hypothetical protein
MLVSPAHAQTPAPLPTPNLDLAANGSVVCVLRLRDGSVVFGGYFTSVNGAAHRNIAKLKPDGTLDATFTLSIDETVYALAADANDKVYVGGPFTMVGGQPRSGIAKFSANGVLDPNWNPGADGPVKAIAVGPNGAVYAGGYFLTIGGQPHNRIAKISAATGAVDAAWTPSLDHEVLAMDINAAGHVFVGGRFQFINGLSIPFLAKLAPGGDGAPDLQWIPRANGYPYALVSDRAGHIYIGGDFTTAGGSNSIRLAKLSDSGTGGADMAWLPHADDYVLGFGIGDAGRLYIMGDFQHIGGQPRARMARLLADGSLDPDFDPSFDDRVSGVVFGNGGTLFVGGAFAHVGGQSRQGIAALAGGNAIFASGFESE